MTAPSGLTELVLVVRDARVSCDFYRDVIGLEVERDASDGWAWLWTGEPDASARLGLSEGPLLFEENSPNPEGKRWGPVHFAIRVERGELESRLARVREAGVEVLGPTHFQWMRAESWYMYDPDGNLAEFWVPDEPEATG